MLVRFPLNFISIIYIIIFECIDIFDANKEQETKYE